jgi:hypothetical protein
MDPDGALTPGYQSYLLRCWCVHAQQEAPRLHFSLVHTGTGVRRGFDDFDMLVAFLRQQIDVFMFENREAGNPPR